jgi:DNA polymerase-3 subunit beta
MLDRTTEAVTAAEITLAAGELHDALARTRHAVSKELTRYYLNGVFIHPAPDAKVLNFVATDGHRLAHVRVPITPTPVIPSVLVGTEFVTGALKLLSRKSHHLLSAKLTLSPRTVSVVDWRGERIAAAPVECTYPDYARAVPYNPPARAIVGRQELVAALEPIAGFLRPTHQRAVKLSVTGDMLTLSATAKGSYPHDIAATAQTVVKLAEPADQTYETGFNADYLLEALKTFGCGRSAAVVSIGAHDFGSPHVLACDNHESYVLMPMRV